MRVLLLILTAIIAYVIGNFGSGMLLSGFIFKKHGAKYMSGNVSLREFYGDFGMPGAVMLVLLDVIRAAAAVVIGGLLMSIVDEMLIGRLFAGFCLLLGNAFPVLQMFKGGKGLVCAATTAFLIDWRIGLCCCVAYIVVIIFTRYEALGAVVGAILAPVFMWVFDFTGLEGVVALLGALLIVMKYAENLVRLVGGTEPKLNLTRTSKGPDFDDEDDDI
jgi:glycerol-3-phosphate acyltransferase PlsY